MRVGKRKQATMRCFIRGLHIHIVLLALLTEATALPPTTQPHPQHCRPGPRTPPTAFMLPTALHPAFMLPAMLPPRAAALPPAAFILPIALPPADFILSAIVLTAEK